MQQYSLSFEALPIENDGYHIRIQANINGLAAWLLIDTGASKSVFDINFFLDNFYDFTPVKEDRLSIGLGNNSLESHSVIIEELILGELLISEYRASLLDLSIVNKSYEKINLNPINGILGGDLLMNLNANIDYSNQTITLCI